MLQVDKPEEWETGKVEAGWKGHQSECSEAQSDENCCHYRKANEDEDETGGGDEGGRPGDSIGHEKDRREGRTTTYDTC